MNRLLLPAKREFDIAARALSTMRGAQQFVLFEDEWKRFLDALEKGWNKIELSLKDSSAPVKALLGDLIAFRKSDSLLVYLRHARNADQHTLAQVIVQQSASLGVGVRPGARSGFIERLIIDGDGKLKEFSGRNMQIVRKPSRIELLPVRDRGVVYGVPTEHLGLRIREPAPLMVATLGLKFYEDTLDELSELVGGGGRVA